MHRSNGLFSVSKLLLLCFSIYFPIGMYFKLLHLWRWIVFQSEMYSMSCLKMRCCCFFKLINRFTVHLDSSLPKIGLNRPFVSPNLLIYEFLNKWNKLRYRKWFRRQQNDKMTISQCWTLLTVCCLVCLVFVPRCFAPDALCWNLWIRCSLLAARPNWGLCGHKTDGVGARGVGAGGEARISSQAS